MARGLEAEQGDGREGFPVDVWCGRNCGDGGVDGAGLEEDGGGDDEEGLDEEGEGEGAATAGVEEAAEAGEEECAEGEAEDGGERFGPAVGFGGCFGAGGSTEADEDGVACFFWRGVNDMEPGGRSGGARKGNEGRGKNRCKTYQFASKQKSQKLYSFALTIIIHSSTNVRSIAMTNSSQIKRGDRYQPKSPPPPPLSSLTQPHSIPLYIVLSTSPEIKQHTSSNKSAWFRLTSVLRCRWNRCAPLVVGGFAVVLLTEDSRSSGLELELGMMASVAEEVEVGDAVWRGLEVEEEEKGHGIVG